MRFLKLLQSDYGKSIIRRIVLGGKIFIILLVGVLIYLMFSFRNGYIGSQENKLRVAQSIVHFNPPPGYQISFAVNDIFSRLVVWDSLTTSQRITLNRVYWKTERKPEGFARKYNHPGKIVKLKKTTFTGIENPQVIEYSTLRKEKQIVPFARVEYIVNKTTYRGMIFCYYDKSSNRTLFVESSAPKDIFNENEVIPLVLSLGTLP
jgi:uncharacterized protein (UPF0248 family)